MVSFYKKPFLFIVCNQNKCICIGSLKYPCLSFPAVFWTLGTGLYYVPLLCACIQHLFSICIGCLEYPWLSFPAVFWTLELWSSYLHPG